MVKRRSANPVAESPTDLSWPARRAALSDAPKGADVAARSLPATAAMLAKKSMWLYGDWARTLLGKNEREVPAKDPRFANPAWRDHSLYRRLGQGYLAFSETADRLAANNPHWRKRERAKFLGGVLTSTLAPSNTLLANPAALKRAFETGGLSLVKGAKNMIDDLLHNKGMPRQVKASAFKKGDSLAATPGAVVFRNEMVELIQYQPMAAEVTERPTLLGVPPIGKYCFMDLAPKRSFIEYAVSRGVPMFVTSWRNPGPEQGHWGVDDYVQTLLNVVDSACEITGSKQLNTLGMCAGGILTTLMLAVMAQRGDRRVNAAAFGVMLLDFDAEAPIGGLKARPVLALVRRRSASKGILPASNLASIFAWMRPNDLVWNHWANNYLMGKEPPSFDISAWSVDGTNLPARLHGQFLDIFDGNLLARPGAFKVLGLPIDLRRVKLETFATGALTDHLTPWSACYKSIQLLGGRSTFVLSNSGHIASLVNPPGNPKASYWVGPRPEDEPEQWRAQATQKAGTWWEVWAEWTLARSGPMRAACTGPGSARHVATAAAPGGYVHQKS